MSAAHRSTDPPGEDYKELRLLRQDLKDAQIPKKWRARFVLLISLGAIGWSIWLQIQPFLRKPKGQDPFQAQARLVEKLKNLDEKLTSIDERTATLSAESETTRDFLKSIDKRTQNLVNSYNSRGDRFGSALEEINASLREIKERGLKKR